MVSLWYTIDYKGCDKKYIMETKLKLKVRIRVKEHRSEQRKSMKQLCIQETGNDSHRVNSVILIL